MERLGQAPSAGSIMQRAPSQMVPRGESQPKAHAHDLSTLERSKTETATIAKSTEQHAGRRLSGDKKGGARLDIGVILIGTMIVIGAAFTMAVGLSAGTAGLTWPYDAAGILIVGYIVYRAAKSLRAITKEDDFSHITVNDTNTGIKSDTTPPPQDESGKRLNRKTRKMVKDIL